MSAILDITAPIFFLILIGYTVLKAGLVPREALPGMSKFVLYVALPSLVFSKLSQMNFSELFDFQFVTTYAVGCIGTFLFVIWSAKRIIKNPVALTGVQGLGGSLPNSAFFGFPLMTQFFADPPTQAFAMALLVENVLLLPIVLAYMEREQAASGHASQSESGLLKRIATNPIILGVVAGVVSSFFKIEIPSFMDQGVSLLASSSAPVALFIIGGTLAGVSLRGNLAEIFMVSGFKLVLQPLLVILMVVFVFPDMDLLLKQAAILLAASPMLSIYPVLGARYGCQAFCSGALLVATVLSFVTVSVVLVLLPLL